MNPQVRLNPKRMGNFGNPNLKMDKNGLTHIRSNLYQQNHRKEKWIEKLHTWGRKEKVS